MKLARKVPIVSPQAYSAAYLLCGSSPTTTIGTWTAVTDGEFTVTIDGTSYDITGIDFSSGVTTLADVASTVQTAIRAATSGSEVVRYDTGSTRFVIISGSTESTSQVSVLSAVSGGGGTDISGAGTAFLDGDSGAADESAVAAELGYQTLTSSYATIGQQFSVAHAGQLSVKPIHKATASGEQVSLYVEVSDDPIGTAEASSDWHRIGIQESSGGSSADITESEYEYDLNAATDANDNPAVPLRYTTVSQKARIRAKSTIDGGLIRGTTALVEH